MDGLVIIDKPKGWTSFDVVAKIRNKFQVKVGHTGTLDPLATGVLVLCLGKATKKAMEITATDKEYIAEVTLGATTVSDDAETEIERTDGAKPISLDELKIALKKFEGEIIQMPPQFSAKKVNGQRAYKAARKGKEVKLEARPVSIHELELLDYKWPVVNLRILCSKGTYIRAIARDLGQALGAGAYLSELQRTKVGQYSLADAHQIGDLDLSLHLKTTDQV